MKKRSFETKLSLKKSSIANLDVEKIEKIKAGRCQEHPDWCQCYMCMTDEYCQGQ